MYAHKFGANEEEEIKLMDGKLGEEILKEVKETNKLENEILDYIISNKRLLIHKINKLNKDIQKESFTIVLNDSLETTFNEPIECKNSEIALINFQTEALFNINETNNVIEVFIDNEWKIFRYNPGCYSGLNPINGNYLWNLYENTIFRKTFLSPFVRNYKL